MGVQLTSTVVQIFARDVQRSIAFYRLLGLPVPEPDGPDPHVDVELPGGNRLSFDAEQTITGMHPDWNPPDAAGRVALAFGLTRTATSWICLLRFPVETGRQNFLARGRGHTNRFTACDGGHRPSRLYAHHSNGLE
jgi:catechol 2,3-dioxygenase-like lactoylglutathione lyase family enzyme